MAGNVFRLEAFINRAGLGSNELANNELGVTIYRFLKRLEAEKGWITQMARNTGAGPGASSNDNYHNEANPALSPFWSYWRWNTTARRTRESYFLHQFGVSPGFNTGVGAPARVQGIAAPSVHGCGFSWAALLDNAMVAQNPWNGSPSTTKGTPVYKNPGVGEQLFVLPVSNHTGGTYATNRENMTGMGASTSYTTSLRAQMIADEDNIGIFVSRDALVVAWAFVLGTYIPLPTLTPLYPVFMLNSLQVTSAQTIFPPDGTTMGSTAGNDQYEGGICGDDVSIMVSQAHYSFLTGAGHNPNPNGNGNGYDVEDIFVGRSANGRLGKIDPEFIRAAGSPLAWGALFDANTRAIIDGTTTTRARVQTKWDGITNPGSGSTREGVDSAT